MHLMRLRSSSLVSASNIASETGGRKPLGSTSAEGLLEVDEPDEPKPPRETVPDPGIAGYGSVAFFRLC